MKLSFRTRRILAVGAVILAIAFGVPRVLTHTPYQRLGVKFDWGGPERVPRVTDIVGPPGKGLLQKGDIVLEIEGKPITRKAVMDRMRGKIPPLPSGPVTLLIERHGQPITIVVPPLQLSTWQRLRAVALPLVTVIAAPLVAILLVWRRPDLVTAWVFLWFAGLQALDGMWSLFRYPQVEVSGGFKGYLTFYHALIFWMPASFLHFMTVFPRPRWQSGHKLRSPWFWLVVAAYVTPVVLLLLGRDEKSRELLYLGFQTIAYPLGSIFLIERYARRRLDWVPKASERVLAIGIAVTLLLTAALDAAARDPQVLAMLAMPAMVAVTTVMYFAWLGSPLVIAYLVANDPAFDPRRVVVRGLPYALLSGILTALFFGVVIVSQLLFAQVTGEEAMTFNVVAALFVAFAFSPLKEKLQRALDRLFGRDPQALRRALDDAGRKLLGALDKDEVRSAVETALARGLRREVAIEWPERTLPRLADPASVRDEERIPVENLLLQAGIRLENLALQEQRAAAERNAVELREAAARAELRALQAQVQPHFLFNALNALSYLTETDPKAAQRFTERLADMLRYTVEAGGRPAALLSDEIAFVEDYLGVARERYENPLCFEYRGGRELLSAAVPPLLLQPLVENSVKHGCAPGRSSLHLALEARQEDGWLTLVFSDDGVASGNGSRGLGVGLQNLEQRVRRFAGAEASMKAAACPQGGFEVTFRWKVESGVAK